MNLNNKGFAISGVLYPLFILFLILILGVIGTLSAAKAVLDANKYEVINKLNVGRIETVDILVVAGGGSGATTMSAHKGGGGGAGGLVFIPNYQVPVYSAVPVYVGSGGEAKEESQYDAALRSHGENGENSFFGELIALGGGGGIRNTQYPGHDGSGGSGGGGHYEAAGGLTLQRTSLSGGFGNIGGSRVSGDMGYGGGGAGTPGMSDNAVPIDGRIQLGRNAGGQGMFEVMVEGKVYNFRDIFGPLSVGHLVGDQLWFSGGGGGGINSTGYESYGAGGYGGGGRGAYRNQRINDPSYYISSGESDPNYEWGMTSAKGEDAMPNTGGGGGGARGGESGAGGSGIVIIRYEGSQKALGGEIFSHNGYTVHVFSDIGGHIFRLI